MNITQKGGGTPPKPLSPSSPSSDALLNLPPKDALHRLTIKKLVNQGEGFKGRLEMGNVCEALVKELLRFEGFSCYGTEPDEHRPGVVYAQEQKDIIVYPQTLFMPPPPSNTSRESWTAWGKDMVTANTLPIEVKSHSKYFRGLEDFQEFTGQEFVTLDDLVPWQKKDPRPRAVVTISQESTFEDLLQGEGLVVAVEPNNHSYHKEIWNGKKTVVRFPLEHCLSWVEFTTWLHKRVFEIEHNMLKGVEQ